MHEKINRRGDTGPAPAVKRGRHNSYRIKRPGEVTIRRSGPATTNIRPLTIPAA